MEYPIERKSADSQRGLEEKFAGEPRTSVSLSPEDAELARLGYKQEFKREFSWISTFSFAFSISGLLATVQFPLCPVWSLTRGQVTTTFGFPLAAGGPPAVVWCWYSLGTKRRLTIGSSAGLPVCALR